MEPDLWKEIKNFHKELPHIEGDMRRFTVELKGTQEYKNVESMEQACEDLDKVLYEIEDVLYGIH